MRLPTFARHLICWSVVCLMAGWFPATATAQLNQSPDPCNGNPSDPRPGGGEPPPPEPKCGQDCGLAPGVDADGQVTLVAACVDTPISDPGYVECNVETNADGLPECSVSGGRASCEVA